MEQARDIEKTSVFFDSELKPGKFLKRPNRFLAEVLIDTGVVLAHIADPGRLKELLVPNTQVFLLPKSGENRKTKWQLLLVQSNDTLVSLNSTLPNELVYKALKGRKIDEFAEYDLIKPEYKVGSSRFDFALAKKEDRSTCKKKNIPSCLLEVKSVTLVEDSLALFPDAPTKRGTKHLKELIELKKEGIDTAVLFVVQRDDANAVKANRKTDLEFALTLKQAYESGVSLFAYKTRLDLEKITLKESLTVIID
ncbi:MAG TPA: DNA/RNA nuclease SfsA [Firmicutes bacterium]|jgi:sugar fermentation stimulation protein A|nr:DNA/RNA nuclease SfsA [Bacillota bacterium]